MTKERSDTNNIIYTGYNLKVKKIDEEGDAVLKKIYNGKINVELYQNEDIIG